MLPNFIMIGAMKSGTSSLHTYLAEHPDVMMSRPKELNFFIEERNWEKGFDWYESKFQSGAAIRGESSVNYTRCHKYKGVPERIHRCNPDMKFLYLLRDPVERVISQYTQMTLMGIEQRGISEVLEQTEDNDLVLTSSYYMQLSGYLALFPKENIQILTFEELTRQKVETIQKVFRFLGVDDTFVGSDWSSVYNRSLDKYERNALGRILGKIPLKGVLKPLLPESLRGVYSRVTAKPKKGFKPQITPEKRQEIIELLREDVRQLREFTGQGFEEWCL